MIGILHACMEKDKKNNSHAKQANYGYTILS